MTSAAHGGTGQWMAYPTPLHLAKCALDDLSNTLAEEALEDRPTLATCSPLHAAVGALDDLATTTHGWPHI